MPWTASSPRPAGSDVVALVASLGGPHALAEVLSSLPATFPARVVVVQHGRAAEDDPDVLVTLLARDCALPVHLVRTGSEVGTPGIMVVPPGYIAEISPPGRYTVRPVPPGHANQPGDLLLGSLAAAVGPGAIAVILTGRLHDGAEGVRAVHRHGGRVVVQDPTGARASGMPLSAIETGCVDQVLPLDRIGPTLVAMTGTPPGDRLDALRPY